MTQVTGPDDVHADRGALRAFEISSPLIRTRRGGRVVLADVPLPSPPPPTRRPTKLAQLLAVAHYIEGLIHSGAVEHRAEVARRLELSRARVTQILDLTLLAPDIQEEILFAEAVGGREPFSERDTRPLLRHWEWAKQRALWQVVKARGEPSGQ